MEVNTHELAWAAGFFDGEGSTLIRRQSRTPQIAVQVAQTDPRVLERFKTAVGSLGNITGPYRSKNARHKEKWSFSAASFEQAQAILAMLWKFLGPVKREQALAVLREYREGQENKLPNLRGVALWTKLAKEGKPLPEGARLHRRMVKT